MKLDYKEAYYKKNFENERNQLKFQLLMQWIKLKKINIQFEEFFIDQEVHHIAIYGMGDLGQLFIDELKDTVAVKVEYGIDKNSCASVSGVKVFTLDNVPYDVDAIIISPVLVSDEIEDEIYEKLGEVKTFTIEEVLYELSRKYDIKSQLWKI